MLYSILLVLVAIFIYIVYTYREHRNARRFQVGQVEKFKNILALAIADLLTSANTSITIDELTRLVTLNALVYGVDVSIGSDESNYIVHIRMGDYGYDTITLTKSVVRGKFPKGNTMRLGSRAA